MNRQRLTSLASTVSAMLVALTLFAVVGVLQAIDDTDAQKLRQMVSERK